MLLLSLAAFLILFVFSELAAHRSVTVIGRGLAFVWCGPFFMLSIAIIQSTVGSLGRKAYLFYISAVLACMAGLIPSLHETPNINWPSVKAGLMIGGLAMLALLFGLLRVGKPKLPPYPPHDIGNDTPNAPHD
jgi:hypothetical protein